MAKIILRQQGNGKTIIKVQNEEMKRLSNFINYKAHLLQFSILPYGLL